MNQSSTGAVPVRRPNFVSNSNIVARVAIGDRGWLSTTDEEGSSPFTGACTSWVRAQGATSPPKRRRKVRFLPDPPTKHSGSRSVCNTETKGSDSPLGLRARRRTRSGLKGYVRAPCPRWWTQCRDYESWLRTFDSSRGREVNQGRVHGIGIRRRIRNGGPRGREGSSPSSTTITQRRKSRAWRNRKTLRPQKPEGECPWEFDPLRSHLNTDLAQFIKSTSTHERR